MGTFLYTFNRCSNKSIPIKAIYDTSLNPTKFFSEIIIMMYLQVSKKMLVVLLLLATTIDAVKCNQCEGSCWTNGNGEAIPLDRVLGHGVIYGERPCSKCG